MLRDVTASFAWSTMTAIWGPSGSGKSTLLSLLGPLSDGATWQEATETAVAALSVVGLERLAESRASELSGGELQRMTVARALAQAHPVVLADEPTGQLDHTSSLVVARALRQLAEAGRAVVVATHDAAVADACDVVWTIEDGRLSAGR